MTDTETGAATRWTPELTARFVAVMRSSRSLREVARRMGMTIGTVSGRSRRLGLEFPRHPPTPPGEHTRIVTEGISRFHGLVREPSGPVLKSGDNQRKLGGRIAKGRWRGMKLYSLTLEERATCPRACLHWRSCYGNNMPYAKRYRHGAALEEQVLEELHALQHAHPAGFVVRLHMLGDFYSTDYVGFWADALAQFPALHVFGYTAWAPDSPIGAAVLATRAYHRGRFEVRFSGIETATLEAPEEAAPGMVVCPVQTHRTKDCSSCGLCWTADRVIAFLRH